MSKTMGNLLIDPIITVVSDGVLETVPLPEVLSRLATGKEVEFERVRPFQEEAWHAFLVQLGALVASKEGKLPQDRQGWRSALFSLGGDSAECWTLFVDDISLPAFMQPATKELNTTDVWKTPDDLDVLITSRAHDIKPHQIQFPRMEDWMFALVSVQTTWGYGGAGNYGVFRNRGSYAARIFVSGAPSFSNSERFLRDVKVWQEEWESIRGIGLRGDVKLLWNRFWSGSEQVEVCDLSPAAIEICRIYRMRLQGESLVCARKSCTAPMINRTQELSGDIWTPLEVDPKSGEKSPMAFRGIPALRDFIKIMFQAEPSPAMRPRPDDKMIILRGVARDPSRQGMTVGYVDMCLNPVFATDEEKQQAFAKATDWMETLSKVRGALAMCLFTFNQGGPEKTDMKSESSAKQVSGWLDKFDAETFDTFTILLSKKSETSEWLSSLRSIFEVIVDDAIKNGPAPSSVRIRGAAKSTNYAGWAMSQFCPKEQAS